MEMPIDVDRQVLIVVILCCMITGIAAAAMLVA